MKILISFTGKKTLNKGDISLVIEEKNYLNNFKHPVIKEINLKNKDNFDKDLKIILRIKVSIMVKTIECGTVGDPLVPNANILEELSNSELDIMGLTFNLVNPKTNKIEASNKGLIKPFKKDTSNHLSPIKINWRDIKPNIWKIDEMNENDLYANIIFDEQIEEKNNLKKDSLLRHLVIPSVLKEMLAYMKENNLFDDDNNNINTWSDKVNYFIKTWGIYLPSDDELEEYDNFIKFANEFIEKFQAMNERNLYLPSINKLNREYFN